MADSYGTHVFSMSKDCKFNSIEGLCNEMNRFLWCSSEGEWVVGNDRIWFSDVDVQYPVAYPNLRALDPDEDDEDDEECEECEECEVELSFQYLSEMFSKYLDSGSFTISCVENLKQRSLSLAALTIHSDGNLEWMFETKSIWGDEGIREVYTKEGELK